MRSCQKILVHCSSRTLLCTFGKFTFWNWFWIDSIHVVTYFVWIPRRLAGGGRRPLTARSQHTCPAGRDGRGPKAPFLRVFIKGAWGFVLREIANTTIILSLRTLEKYHFYFSPFFIFMDRKQLQKYIDLRENIRNVLIFVFPSAKYASA